MVCFISVNYSNFELTIKMYESLAKSKSVANFDFIIIDNSESDLEYNNLSDYFKNIPNIFIYKIKNGGYFNGLNYGLSLINTSKYKYVVIGNNDLIFESNFIEILESKKYDDNVYAICPDVISSDGYHQNPHVINKLHIINKLKLDLYNSNYIVAKLFLLIKNLLKGKRKLNKDMIGKEIHMGIGAIYILTDRFFEKNKDLFFPFFLYGEEAFLSNQIHETCGILYYEPNLIVYHLESATLSKTPSRLRYNWNKESYKIHRRYL